MLSQTSRKLEGTIGDSKYGVVGAGNGTRLAVSIFKDADFLFFFDFAASSLISSFLLLINSSRRLSNSGTLSNSLALL